MKRISWALLIGDALVLAVVVAIGLRTHEESSLARLPFTWLPFLVSWLVAGQAFGLFADDGPRGWPLVGRLLWAVALAAPLAAVLRAAWLGTAVLPIFVLVMGATSLLGLLLWRLAYAWWTTRRNG